MSDFQLFIDSIKSDSDEEINCKFQIEFLEMEDNDSCRPLHHACQYGRIGLVKLLLFNHCKIDSVAKNGYQPIHVACKNGYIDIVKILIGNNCELNTSEKFDGYKLIHLACENGHIEIMKILIANKCDINTSSNWGYKPIHLACANGHIDIVRILIINNCDLNSSDYWGCLPMHLACANGHIDIVKLLIAIKCDINASNKVGYQPIHFASKFGHIDILKILIENKCDINATDKFRGYKPLHLACMNGHIDIVKLLIANKCDINASVHLGNQPIHLACESGHTDIVKILIENNCDFNTPDNIGYQPMHLACENGHVDIVKILIEYNCDINVCDKWGNQPINLSCMNGHIGIVKILIENKCDINTSNESGNQPIHLACKNGHNNIVEILIANNCDMNDLSKMELIAKATDLYCKVGCDHKFCRKTLEDEKFRKGELIGEGGFGKIFKYKISNTNREIVIKRTKSNWDDIKNIEGNINKYLFRILHGNIVRYFGALEKSGKLSIYMEYLPGGSLKNLIDKLKKKGEWIENLKVIKFSKQILEGLQFIHSQGIIHRDIKPENMLLDHDETLKLTDFGLSKSLRILSISKTTTKARTTCGTERYMAQEVIIGEEYGFPADIWSTGASIIHMIIGEMSYNSVNATVSQESVTFSIGSTKKIVRAHYIISETMLSFINDLLTPEQSLRPSAQTSLNHSIFKDLEQFLNLR